MSSVGWTRPATFSLFQAHAGSLALSVRGCYVLARPAASLHLRHASIIAVPLSNTRATASQPPTPSCHPHACHISHLSHSTQVHSLDPTFRVPPRQHHLNGPCPPSTNAPRGLCKERRREMCREAPGSGQEAAAFTHSSRARQLARCVWLVEGPQWNRKESCCVGGWS